MAALGWTASTKRIATVNFNASGRDKHPPDPFVRERSGNAARCAVDPCLSPREKFGQATLVLWEEVIS